MKYMRIMIGAVVVTLVAAVMAGAGAFDRDIHTDADAVAVAVDAETEAAALPACCQKRQQQQAAAQGFCKSEGKDTKQQQQDIDALLPLKEYVGRWRGLGTKGRGTTQKAWKENSDWEYDFPDDRTTLIFDCPDAKYYKEGEILPAKNGKTFRFILQPVDGRAPTEFTGEFEEGRRGRGGKLVLTADKRVPELPARITIRIVARGDRMIIAYEKPFGKDGYAQLGEVGFTRKGSGFGGTGSPANACVVTGGWGNGQVSYKGKSYYICCTGCRDMFNRDPEQCLADYAKREEEAERRRKERDNR